MVLDEKAERVIRHVREVLETYDYEHKQDIIMWEREIDRTRPIWILLQGHYYEERIRYILFYYEDVPFLLRLEFKDLAPGEGRRRPQNDCLRRTLLIRLAYHSGFAPPAQLQGTNPPPGVGSTTTLPNTPRAEDATTSPLNTPRVEDPTTSPINTPRAEDPSPPEPRFNTPPQQEPPAPHSLFDINLRTYALFNPYHSRLRRPWIQGLPGGPPQPPPRRLQLSTFRRRTQPTTSRLSIQFEPAETSTPIATGPITGRLLRPRRTMPSRRPSEGRSPRGGRGQRSPRIAGQPPRVRYSRPRPRAIPPPVPTVNVATSTRDVSTEDVLPAFPTPSVPVSSAATSSVASASVATSSVASTSAATSSVASTSAATFSVASTSAATSPEASTSIITISSATDTMPFVTAETSSAMDTTSSVTAATSSVTATRSSVTATTSSVMATTAETSSVASTSTVTKSLMDSTYMPSTSCGDTASFVTGMTSFVDTASTAESSSEASTSAVTKSVDSTYTASTSYGDTSTALTSYLATTSTTATSSVITTTTATTSAISPPIIVTAPLFSPPVTARPIDTFGSGVPTPPSRSLRVRNPVFSTNAIGQIAAIARRRDVVSEFINPNIARVVVRPIPARLLRGYEARLTLRSNRSRPTAGANASGSSPRPSTSGLSSLVRPIIRPSSSLAGPSRQSVGTQQPGTLRSLAEINVPQQNMVIARLRPVQQRPVPMQRTRRVLPGPRTPRSPRPPRVSRSYPGSSTGNVHRRLPSPQSAPGSRTRRPPSSRTPRTRPKKRNATSKSKSTGVQQPTPDAQTPSTSSAQLPSTSGTQVPSTSGTQVPSTSDSRAAGNSRSSHALLRPRISRPRHRVLPSGSGIQLRPRRASSSSSD